MISGGLVRSSPTAARQVMFQSYLCAAFSNEIPSPNVPFGLAPGSYFRMTHSTMLGVKVVVACHDAGVMMASRVRVTQAAQKNQKVRSPSRRV